MTISIATFSDLLHSSNLRRGLHGLVLASALTAGAACTTGPTGDDGGTGTDGGDGDVTLPDNVGDMADNYAAIVLASYEDSLTSAEALDVAIDAFVTAPTDITLEAAKQAWLASREPYLQTEVYRFYEGPIDNEDDGPEGQINAWPLDENYIDYTADDPTGGIINDPNQEITAANLAGLNEQGGDANIATGFHAIEFLLWGQDLSVDGPGDRPVTDYTTADNADRRALYLQTVSEMLVSDLQDMVDAWDTSGATYGADFVGADAETQLERVMTGMIVLTGFETGSERLKPALDNHDQEDEHSCFSDNTHRDMIQDVQGVINVWTGSYGSISGTGVDDVIAELDSDLAADITSALNEALSLANALPVPFDQAIASGNDAGNQAVQALIDQLFVTEGLLEDAFRAAGLSIPVTE